MGSGKSDSILFFMEERNMMNELVFNICLAIVVAIFGIIAKSVIPFLKAKKDAAMEQLRDTRWFWVADLVDSAVAAVEQTVKDDMHGDDKKELAMHYIMEVLKENNIEISVDQLNTLIEAAVKAMNDDLPDSTVIDAEPDEEIKTEE